MTDNLMRLRAEQKARELEHADQSFEAKNARAVAKIDRQLKGRIDGIRLILPAVPPVSERHQGFMRRRNTDFVIGKCKFCEPDPKWFKCPLCDYETPNRWTMKLHNIANPRWCQERAAKKARKWSQHA